jgi:hypothetical protein
MLPKTGRKPPKRPSDSVMEKERKKRGIVRVLVFGAPGLSAPTSSCSVGGVGVIFVEYFSYTDANDVRSSNSGNHGQAGR